MNAGYSSTSQLKKLGIFSGTRIDLIGAPVDWAFETEPDGAVYVTDNSSADVILGFARTAQQLEALVDTQADRIRPAGALWIAWPRKAAGHESDVTENLIRDVVLPRGLVDVKVAAIDTDWSGLKIVWRVENR